MPISLDSLSIDPPVLLAPLAGITDLSFRRMVARFGAGLVVSEMIASEDMVNAKPQARAKAELGFGEAATSVQLAGRDARLLAEAARYAEGQGARIIDINMGCPVKKVCNVASGSALLRNEPLVADIVKSVVEACRPHDVPVTLKTRTGWDAASKNALRIATLAQDLGIAALTLHGRTRADMYKGRAEYDTIREVKQALEIPVIANGDIDSPEKAQYVLQYTGADAVMIGRAAQGRPWIFREIAHFLETGNHLPPPTYGELRDCLLEHLEHHYRFYGQYTGVRSARKHIGWYLADMPEAESLITCINQAEQTADQIRALEQWFDNQPSHEPISIGPTALAA